MSKSLEGKIALVTGASRGIGLAIAEALGMAGAKVVVSSRKQEAIDAVAASLQLKGIEAVGVACNTGNIPELAILMAQTVERFGGIDILVNNAATNPVFGGVEHTEEWAFDKIMAVNVKGPFELSKLALPHFQQRGGGAIINISSVGGITPETQLGIYSVSKAALNSLTKVLAKEWGADNVRVNAICPGLIQTKFSEALWSNEAIFKHTMESQPIDRIGTPEEVAALAVFLASPSAGFITGAVYVMDGGRTI